MRFFKKALKMIVILMVGVAATQTAWAADGEEIPKKLGILLVAFGSSEASAQVSFEKIDRKVKATYPETGVRWAFTSHIIRQKLKEQGKELSHLKEPLHHFN